MILWIIHIIIRMIQLVRARSKTWFFQQLFLLNHFLGGEVGIPGSRARANDAPMQVICWVVISEKSCKEERRQDRTKDWSKAKMWVQPKSSLNLIPREPCRRNFSSWGKGAGLVYSYISLLAAVGTPPSPVGRRHRWAKWLWRWSSGEGEEL